jgi:NifU-like protein involved in Fe-S cluster formation
MDKKIPSNIIELSQNETSFGRMNDASGSAYMKGLCGDEMEFYLVIENNVVIQVKYYTDGVYLPKPAPLLRQNSPRINLLTKF